jgi:cytidyltransferase-like protein
MILSGNELNHLRADHPDQTIAFRLGCYDVLHYGHQKGIDFAASQADMLIVGIMPDEYITRHKARIPVNTAEKRVEAIDQAEGVHASFIVPGIGMLAVTRSLRRLRPNVYVEEDEHRKTLSKTLLLGSMGIRYVIDSTGKVASSRDIISQYGRDEAARLSGLSFHPEVSVQAEDLEVSHFELPVIVKDVSEQEKMTT